MNEIIYKFVNRRPVALLLDIQDSGTRNLERTAPPHVDIYNSFQEIDQNRYEALLIVSPFIYPVVIPTLYYRPHVLSLGFGCRENCDPSGVREYITARLIEAGISPTSLTNLATIDIKKDEPVVDLLTHSLILSMDSYSPDELRNISVPNPSEKVREVTSSPSVAEAAAL